MNIRVIIISIALSISISVLAQDQKQNVHFEFQEEITRSFLYGINQHSNIRRSYEGVNFKDYVLVYKLGSDKYFQQSMVDNKVYETGAKDDAKAMINLGFYGCNPKSIKKSILVKPTKKNKKTGIENLFADVLGQGASEFITNRKFEDIHLLIIPIAENKEFAEEFKKTIDIRSPYLYIIWNKMGAAKAPKLVENLVYEDIKIIHNAIPLAICEKLKNLILPDIKTDLEKAKLSPTYDSLHNLQFSPDKKQVWITDFKINKEPNEKFAKPIVIHSLIYKEKLTLSEGFIKKAKALKNNTINTIIESKKGALTYNDLNLPIAKQTEFEFAEIEAEQLEEIKDEVYLYLSDIDMTATNKEDFKVNLSKDKSKVIIENLEFVYMVDKEYEKMRIRSMEIPLVSADVFAKEQKQEEEKQSDNNVTSSDSGVLHFYYLDISEFDNIRKIQMRIDKEIKEINANGQSYFMFLSNMDNPVTARKDKEYLKILKKMSTLNADPPSARDDKRRLLEIAEKDGYTKHPNIQFHFYLSETTYKRSKEYILNQFLNEFDPKKVTIYLEFEPNTIDEHYKAYNHINISKQ